MSTSVDGWKFMKAGDAISGKEGALYANIDGEVIQVAECKNISAKITKNKNEFKALGYRGTQHKATGWTGTGTLVIHYATSRFAKMMIDYTKTGKDQYFTLQIINKDPTSEIGTQTVNLYQVNLDESEIAKLDTDAEFLDQSMNFTFSDVEMADEFSQINS
jgi:hypothetical protein